MSIDQFLNQISLQDLVQNLSHQQVRDLRDLIEDVNFHCDIVGKLPLEICLSIFQHLELYQTFQAQLVSRRWAEILTSRPVVDSVMKSWYQGKTLFAS